MDDKRRRIGKRTANRSTKRKDKQLYRKVTEANWWQQLVRFFKIKRTNKTTQEELPKYNRRKEHKRQNDHREGTDAPKRRTRKLVLMRKVYYKFDGYELLLFSV